MLLTAWMAVMKKNVITFMKVRAHRYSFRFKTFPYLFEMDSNPDFQFKKKSNSWSKFNFFLDFMLTQYIQLKQKSNIRINPLNQNQRFSNQIKKSLLLKQIIRIITNPLTYNKSCSQKNPSNFNTIPNVSLFSKQKNLNTS